MVKRSFIALKNCPQNISFVERFSYIRKFCQSRQMKTPYEQFGAQSSSWYRGVWMFASSSWECFSYIVQILSRKAIAQRLVFTPMDHLFATLEPPPHFWFFPYLFARALNTQPRSC